MEKSARKAAGEKTSLPKSTVENVSASSTLERFPIVQLQRLIGNHALRSFLQRANMLSSARGTIARSNVKLKGRGRVANMGADEIEMKLTGSVGAKRADNHPEDVQKVQQRLHELGYLSAEHLAAETPTPAAKDKIAAKDLTHTILAIRAFQRHALLTSNVDGRIDPNGTSHKMLDVDNTPVENTAKRAADEITSMFESGGDYGETFLGDRGVVSYGKHQATLTSGTLYKLLNHFVTTYKTQSDAARQIESYLSRVRRQDESLMNDSAFIELLEKAGRDDPFMQQAQDEFFDSHYGGESRKKMQEAGVTSALAYAFFYDNQIHGGLGAYDLPAVLEKLGGKVGEKGKDGKTITEADFMRAMAHQRQDRNRRAGEKQVAKAQEKYAEADKLEGLGKTEEAAHARREGRKLEKNGNALTRSATDPNGRLQMWVNWAENGDLDLRGDANGMLMVKGVPVLGLKSGANLREATPTKNTPQTNSTSMGGGLFGGLAGWNSTQPTSQTAPESSKNVSQSGGGSWLSSLMGLASFNPQNMINEVGSNVEQTLKFFAKARRVNQKYAAKPPLPGWPYRKELHELWQSQQYDEFAIKVVRLQTGLLGVAPDDPAADGILGGDTARAILDRSNAEFLIPEAQPANDLDLIELENDNPPAPTATTSGQTQTTENSPPAPQPTTTPTSTAPAAGATSPAIDSILAPVRQLYQQHEKLNAKLRLQYAAGPQQYDLPIAKIRWQILKLNLLEKEREKAGKTLTEKEIKQREDLTAKMEALQKKREEEVNGKNTESAIAAYRQQNPERIRKEHELLRLIAAARSQINGLSDPQQRALAYTELNRYTPYHYQFENADILYNDHHGGYRTCNVTTATMTLEALGKQPANYANGQRKSNLALIAEQFSGTIQDRGVTASQEVDNLRMPDFMQLVAVDQILEDKPATKENIASARYTAQGKILKIDFLEQIVKAFGAKGEQVFNRQSNTLTSLSNITVLAGNRSRGESDRSKERQAAIGKLFSHITQTISPDMEPLKELNDTKTNEEIGTALTTASTELGKKRTAANDSTKDETKVTGEILTQFKTIQTALGNKRTNETERVVAAKQAIADVLQKANENAALQEALQAALAPLQALPDTTKEISERVKKSVNAVQQIQTQAAEVKKTVYDEVGGELKQAASALKNTKLNEAQRRRSALQFITQALTSVEVYGAGGSYQDMHRVLSVEAYKRSFVGTVTSALNSGHQVVVGLNNHYVRLQSVEEDGFVIDDPGYHNSESRKITWDQGIADGYFRYYLIVKP